MGKFWDWLEKIYFIYIKKKKIMLIIFLQKILEEKDIEFVIKSGRVRNFVKLSANRGPAYPFL